MEQIVIVGVGETGQIAYEYFTHDSPHKVVAFSVEERFIQERSLYGLPVVPFESLDQIYHPSKYGVFIGVSYTQLNRVRTRLYHEAKRKDFSLVSYISSKAFVWRNVKIGDNCFIFENNVIQHQVQVGNNVILWSGNHIGHQTKIGDNSYVSSHVVISGFCEIGENCFLGVNCSFNDRIRVAPDCVIGSGAVVVKDTQPAKVYVGNPAKPLEKSSFRTFNVQED